MAKGTSKNNIDLKPDLPGEKLRAARGRGDHIAIHGILGEEENGRVKVYLNYELSAYVLLPVEHITARERTTDDSGMDLSIIHFNKQVKVEVVRMTREQVESDFLAEALSTTASENYPSADNEMLLATPATPATPTIVRTVTLATRYLCTKAACRVTMVCTVICSRVCPKPWTKNWFC